MYRASDERDNADWLAQIEVAADRLDLGTTARSRARDLFLSTVSDRDCSERVTMAASLYVGALATGEKRSQQSVADAAEVSRLSVQRHWKTQLEAAGLEPPDW